MHERRGAGARAVEGAAVGVEDQLAVAEAGDPAAARELGEQRVAHAAGEALAHVVRLGRERRARRGAPVAPADLERGVARAAGGHRRAGAPQRAEQAGEPALGAEVLPDRGRAAGAELQHRGQPRIGLRRPRLPGRERRAGRRERGAEVRRGADAVHAHLEARHDPEVAAAPAAQRPEQVRVVARVDAAQPPVGRDHHEPRDVVGRQPERPRGEAVAAAEREPAEADGRARAAGHRAAVAGERVHDLDHVRARADARAAAAAVDGDRPQPPQVDDDAFVERRVAGVGMPAGARRHADVVAVGPAQHRLHVAAVARDDDRVRPRAVEARVVDPRRAG